jgi:peptidoglycan/xylan/chitin deacetylase (PgdA/CDA1 family)
VRSPRGNSSLTTPLPSFILLYHRVADPEFDPLCLAVTPDHFREHMHILRQRCLPVSLDGVWPPRPFGSGPRPVAVTFDDGYADNLTSALPVLEEEEVPATVFSCGWRGEERPPGFWWDRLAGLVFGTDRWLIRPLEVAAAGETRVWSLEGETGAGLQPVDTTWSVLREDDPDVRYSAYRWLSRALRLSDAKQRQEAMRRLEAWAGDLVRSTVSEVAPRLDAGELIRLADSPMITIGSHTMTHPVLASLSASEQFEEIDSARLQLQAITGRPVTTFSYPFGTGRDFSATTLRALRKAGVTLGCANQPGLVTASSGPYRLPRFLVRDCDGEAFEALLASAGTYVPPRRTRSLKRLLDR